MKILGIDGETWGLLVLLDLVISITIGLGLKFAGAGWTTASISGLIIFLGLMLAVIILGSERGTNKYLRTERIPVGLLAAFMVLLIFGYIVAVGNPWLIASVLWLCAILSYKRPILAIALILLGVWAVVWATYLGPMLKKAQPTCVPPCPKDQVEGFYTLFTPFHREQEAMKYVNTVALSPEATKKLRVRSKKLTIGATFEERSELELISSLLLSRARILNIGKWQQNPAERLCRDLALGLTDIALLPGPVVRRGYKGILAGSEGMKMTDIRFLANIGWNYIICISSVESGVQNINQLRGKRVGVPTNMTSIWSDLEPSIFPDGVGSTKFVQKDQVNLFYDLRDLKLDAFFYAGRYPSPFLDGIIYSELRHRYQFVPVMLRDENAFLKEHTEYQASTISVNYDSQNNTSALGVYRGYLPSRYTPTALGRIWFDNLTDNFWTLGYNTSMVCTNTLDDFTGYEIAKTVLSSRTLLDKHRGHPLSIVDIANPSLAEVPIQDGARTFYLEKGMVSECGEPGCMQVIGNRRCILCDKGVRKTEMQWKSVLAAEKTMPNPGCAIPFTWKDV